MSKISAPAFSTRRLEIIQESFTLTIMLFRALNLENWKFSWITFSSKTMWHWKICRYSPPEVFSGKVVLAICSKFTGEHSCQNVISINHTSARVFSCKFAAYFRKTFYLEHLWKVAYYSSAYIWGQLPIILSSVIIMSVVHILKQWWK